MSTHLTLPSGTVAAAPACYENEFLFKFLVSTVEPILL